MRSDKDGRTVRRVTARQRATAAARRLAEAQEAPGLFPTNSDCYSYALGEKNFTPTAVDRATLPELEKLARKID